MSFTRFEKECLMSKWTLGVLGGSGLYDI